MAPGPTREDRWPEVPAASSHKSSFSGPPQRALALAGCTVWGLGFEGWRAKA